MVAGRGLAAAVTGMSQIESRLIARYGTLSLLGAGGMGTVYRVFDPVRGTQVAIKALKVSDPALLERLRREARVLESLSHPNVCALLEWCEEPGAAWIVMPVLDGQTLDRCAPELDVGVIVELLIQACSGVEAAHALGLVHRDLKPANLMVSKDPEGSLRAVIMDFGIARVCDATTLTGTHEVLGTPAYMAPEQARGDSAAVDVRADVWGLGATLYDALTGQAPFGSGSLAQVMARVLDSDVVSPLVHRPELPEALARICLKALERDPGRRYTSVAELRSDLQRFAQGARVSAPSHGPGVYLRRMLTRHPRFWGAMGALTLALFGALLFAFWTSYAAAERAAAARDLATTAERVRAGMRAARLAPLHDIDRDRAPLLADIEALQQRYGDAGSAVRTDLDRALAQAWFELGRLDDARMHAAAVLDGTPQASDRLLYSHIQLALYAQAWPAIADLPPAEREVAVSALRQAHLEPVLAALKDLPQRPPLLDAELDLIEQRWDAAAAILAAYTPEDGADPAALLLAGDLARARGQQAQDQGDLSAARLHYEQAHEHYAAATVIVRSDPQTLARSCAVAARLQALAAIEGRVFGSSPEALDQSCVALQQADGMSQNTRETLAGAWLALAVAQDQSNQPAMARTLLAEAITAATKAVALDPARSQARLLLARALRQDAGLIPDDYALKRARLDAAIEQLQAARLSAPGALPVLVALGESLRDRGRLKYNYRQVQPDPASPAATLDYLAARDVLQQAVDLQPQSVAPRQALSLTLMFLFYAHRDHDPPAARGYAEAAIQTLDAILRVHPDHPDLLFDQAANLGDLWSFEIGVADAVAQAPTGAILQRAFELFARLRAVAPDRPDGYDYEIGFRAQAAEKLRDSNLPRTDILQPVPALAQAAADAKVTLSEQYLGWALTERALALADSADPAAEAAFGDALVLLERGVADADRHYDSIRMLLQWSGARAELLAPTDARRGPILSRAEALFDEAIAGERGRGDNILWCEGARIAYERRSVDATALAAAVQRYQRCRDIGPLRFRAWLPRLQRAQTALQARSR
jgi:hypothetical protein